jgi:phage I-like protein
MPHPAASVSLACMTSRITAGAPVQLLPSGAFKTWNGSPVPPGGYKLTANNAAKVLVLARARVNEFVFDYEHQTQLSEKNGMPAPAAGWFSGSDVDYVDGKGLVVNNVRWTARAKAHIEAEEYKYVSAVFMFDKNTGEVKELYCAALTNDPGLHGMDSVQMAALSARFAATPFTADTDPALDTVDNPSEKPMNPVLLACLTALGLPQTDAVTAEQATTAIAALKAQADSATALTTEVAALKSAAPDAAKYVTLDKFTEVSAALATLTAKQAGDEVEALIVQARSEGKCIPAVEAVWRDVGKANLAQLKSLVAAAPANPALAGQTQTQGKAPAGDASKAGTPEELAMCKNMGLSIEEFRKGADAA